MVTTSVSNVRIAQDLLEEKSSVKIISGTTRKKVESCSDPYGTHIPCEYHPLVAASHMAYDEHRPLVLSPDMIWLTIAQGISFHVNANSEELRSQFVNFDGKMLLEIYRDEFVMGSHDNDWPGAFSEFSDKIKHNTKPGIYDLLVSGYSTTGSIEKSAYEITLMDTVKSYFEYMVHTRCGIPEVTLEGTKEDWSDLHKRVKSLSTQFGLEWWLSELLPVLSAMASTADGKKNGDLWENWYKINGGSGGPYISGHVTKFFPYLKDYQTKEFTSKVKDFKTERHFGGLTTERLPTGLSSTPFIWNYYQKKFKMSFMAGFVGCTQDKETMAVRPKIGWAIINEGDGMDPSFFRTCAKCQKKDMIEEFSYSMRNGRKKMLCNDCFFD